MKKKFAQLIVGGISLTLALTSIPTPVFATNLEDLSDKIEISVETDVEVDTEISVDTDVEVDTEINIEMDTQVDVKDEVLTQESQVLDYAVVLASNPKQEFIKRLYQTCLGRNANDEEVDYWVSKIDAGIFTGSSLANYFMNSEELKSQNLSNISYINVLYRAFFDRSADEIGLEYWISSMATGLSRENALKLFIDSQEYTDICLEYGIQKGEVVNPDEAPSDYTPIQKFAYRFYKKCMGRTPDIDGLNYWAQGLEQNTFTGQEIAESFVKSAEFINKNLSNSEYIDVMYSVFFDRAADHAGKNYWLSMMNSWNRDMILQYFIKSEEFFDICMSYGIIAINENPDIKGFTKGTGTKKNPYIITKPTQLSIIEEYITEITESTYFALGQDIDMQDIRFSPIGQKATFKGQFDGRGYKISNLSINTDNGYGSMFVKISENSSIANLNLTKVSVINLKNKHYTAGLVGENVGSIINCHVSGTLRTTNYYTGGLVAYNNGIIDGCSFEGTCTSGGGMGGLVGGNEGTINNSYAKSTNNGGNTLGGLIGNNYGTVMNSYAITDSTTNYAYAGGLIGYDERGKVYNCFAIGSVSGNYQSRGGLIGKSEYGYFENCYAAVKLNSVTSLGSSYYNGLLIGYSIGANLSMCYGNSDTFTAWGYREGNKTGCELFTTDEMKADTFVEKLNSNITSTYWSKWTRDNNVNNGLPYLMN